MPNIKKTAKNILYICKRWIAGKLYIISVWTKDIATVGEMNVLR